MDITIWQYLYNAQGEENRAKKLLEACAKMDRDFVPAKRALEKFETPSRADWYHWWFRSRQNY